MQRINESDITILSYQDNQSQSENELKLASEPRRITAGDIHDEQTGNRLMAKLESLAIGKYMT